MKQLAILRHAKSQWSDRDLPDFDRPLNARGRAAAARLGIEMNRRDLAFDLVLASPAARVRETIARLSEHYSRKLSKIEFDEQIYLAPCERLFDRIRSLTEAVEFPLLVGHNPGLHELALALAAPASLGHHQGLAERLPTGALVIFVFPAMKWSELRPATGRIELLILPRELD